MNIKTKLAVRFSLLVIAILIFFSALVWFLSLENEKSSFRKELFMEAKNTAILLINVAEVDSLLLQKIHTASVSLEQEEIALFDENGKLVYGHNNEYPVDSLLKTKENIDEIYYFDAHHKDGICIKHEWKGKTYLVYVMAYDNSRRENINKLLNILMLSIIFSIAVAIILSYIFSRNAIKPIAQIIKGIGEINLQKLNARLPEGNKKDEIAKLAISFNEMLDSLESAFKSQNEFVLNASHELKTPLAVMIVESDYILSHSVEKDDYIKHIKKILDDLKQLNAVSSSLLELAQINEGRSLKMSDIQIDEVIYSSVKQVKIKYPDRKILIKINYPENENELIINGNFGLLEIAFNNILDNACKFSQEDVIIELVFSKEHINISIADKGIGIPAEEIGNIFKPFHRGDNAKFIGGYGIGLALASKIFEMHNSLIKVTSGNSTGTVFNFTFHKYTSQEHSV